MRELLVEECQPEVTSGLQTVAAQQGTAPDRTPTLR